MLVFKNFIKNKKYIYLFSIVSFIYCSKAGYNNKKMQIFLNYPNGKTNLITLSDKYDKIDRIKYEIQDKIGLDPGSYFLSEYGRKVSETKLLKPFSKIDVLPKITGGARNILFQFTDFKNSSCYKKFSKKAPSYRIIYPGINLEAVCPKCKKTVWVNLKVPSRYKGKKIWDKDECIFDASTGFNLAKLVGKCVCSNCKHAIQELHSIFTCGFYKCNFYIVGGLQDLNKTETYENSTYSDDGFLYFNGTKLKTWRFIDIVVWKK